MLQDLSMTPLDWRLAFLARAGARLRLVEAGEIDIDDAITELIESVDRRWLLERIVRKRPLPCACECNLIGRWERMRPPVKKRRAAA
jgi:hypothetical protein